jgi:hypothetical protein
VLSKTGVHWDIRQVRSASGCIAPKLIITPADRDNDEDQLEA